MHRPTAAAIVTLLIPLGFSEETRGQADPEERPLVIDYGYSYPPGMGSGTGGGATSALPRGSGRGSTTLTRPGYPTPIPAAPRSQPAPRRARATAMGDSTGWSTSDINGPPEEAPPAEPVPLLHRPGMRYFVQSQQQQVQPAPSPFARAATFGPVVGRRAFPSREGDSCAPRRDRFTTTVYRSTFHPR